MKISRYYDFISESKLELLLEANIRYSDRFTEILSKLKSPIAKNLLELFKKDIDVPTNYIDAIMDKEDTVSFIQDNKAVRAKIVSNAGEVYTGLAGLFRDKPEKSDLVIKDIDHPSNGDRITEITEIPLDVVTKYHESPFWQSLYPDNALCVITFINRDGEVRQNIIKKSGISESENLADGPKSEIKIGRLARRMLDKAGIKVTDKEIEEFVNEYKSRIQIEKDVFRNMEIVSGPAIAEWYNEAKYLPSTGGTLASSCMRYSKCSKYFGIYTQNPNQVSLVILKTDPEETDTPLLKGRALLWTDTRGRKFMDRVYTNKDSDVNIFIQFAHKNGWLYKKHQENDESTPLMLNGEQVSSDDWEVVVKLDRSGEYSYYPYLDTLKFYNAYHGELTNDDGGSYDYKLEDTSGGNGSCDECGGSGEVECNECNGEGHFSCNECDGDGEVDCGECDGSGKVEDGDGNTIDCPECDGKGKIECSNCDGSGEEDCSDCRGRGRHDCYECS